MKESLKILRVISSGVGESVIIDKGDEDVYQETKKIEDCCEKVAYLRSLIDESTTGFIKSKLYLAELVTKCDYQFACKLIYSACYESPLEAFNYFKFAEIAIQHSAWKVAKSLLEVAIWLCTESDLVVLTNSNVLLKLVLEKISKGEIDNSFKAGWERKEINKSWILDVLYLRKNKKTVSDYAYRL